MTNLKSLSAPAIGEDGVKRLFHATDPQRLDRNCTLFDAGYEEAKRMFREKLVAEVGRPHDDAVSLEGALRRDAIAPVSLQEQAARHKSEAKRGWWAGIVR